MIYKVMDYDDKMYQYFIKTDASKKQLEQVIQQVKDTIKNYSFEDIVPALLKAGYLAEDVTPHYEETINF